jgi:hypothetical protein
MNKNKAVQAFLPSHIVAWIDGEAKRAKATRSQWIATFINDLFQGQDVREEARENTFRIRRQLAFAMCALDSLLDAHPDPKLRQRVAEAVRQTVCAARVGMTSDTQQRPAGHQGKFSSLAVFALQHPRVAQYFHPWWQFGCCL